MAVTKYLDKTGLSHFWSKIKAWANSLFALDSAVVHKTGNEIINGTKTFSQNIVINKTNSALTLKANNIDATVVSNEYYFSHAIAFNDKNDIAMKNRLSMIRAGRSEYDANFIQIAAVNPVVDSIDATSITVYYYRNGLTKAVAPSTLSSDDLGDLPSVYLNERDILTRDWIPKDIRIVHTTSNESIAGIKTFSSSPIVPTPTTSDNSTKVATTAFVKAQGYLTGIVAVSNGGTGHGEILTETTATDFNDYVNTGEYHVRFSVNTLNRPYAYTDYRDCILTVSNISPSSNVSSYYRILQTAIVLNPTVDKHPTMFIRKKYNNSNNEWSDWYQVSYINDSPEKFSNLAINLDTISTIPSTDTYSTIYRCHTNDDKTVADMYIGRGTSSSGFTNTVLRTRCSDGVSTNHAYFQLWCNADGTSKYSTTSAVFGSTDNSDKIPTTAWIRTATGNTSLNAATATKLATARTINDVLFDGSANITIADSTKLPLIGGTITGNLYINGVLTIRHTNIIKGTDPENWTCKDINIRDNSSNSGDVCILGKVRTAISTTGTVTTELWASKFETGATTTARISLIYPKTGDPYATCPTPTSVSENSNKIATTAWVRDATGNFACNAATATKLGTSTVGDSSQPIYLSNGSPVACGMGAYPYKGVETSSTALPVRWPWTDIRTDSTEGFDKFTTIGRYHVNASADTFNNPTNSTMDGVLIVDATTTASSVSSYYRIKQTYLTLGSAGTYNHVYIRGAYYKSSEAKWVFGAWEELSFTDHTHNYLPLGGGTLTDNLIIKNSNVTKGTAPSSTAERLIRFSDSANHKIGALSAAYYTDKSSKVGIYAYNTSVATSESNIGYIAVGSKEDGSVYTYAPNPVSNSDDNSIATTKWVTDKAYDYVKLTGDQTIAGNKTFSSRITLHGSMSGRGIEYVANTLTKGTAPSSNQAMYFYFIDKNGYSSSQNNTFGAVGISQYTDGTVAARLVGYSNDASTSTYGAVVAGVDSDGIAFAMATATSDTRTEGADIVTRNWIPKDTRIVHTTGNETISGTKTFSTNQKFSAEGIFKSSATAYLEIAGGSAINKGSRIVLYGESHTSNAGFFDIRASASATKAFIGKPDGTLTWNGQSIQVSSDERIKTKLQNVPENILNAWEDIEWGEFKFLEAVANKGESARLHTGLIAQAVDKAFKAKNLNACKYGILCHEEREATEDEPAVDLWTVRYTEALAMEAAYQRRKNKILEKRISDLEEQLSSVLEILNNLKGA